mgnify:CR=1 FL=1
MRKLNTLIAPALVAALALGAASPTLAQGYPGRDYPAHDQRDRGNFDRGRVEQVRSQINQLQEAVNRNDYRNRISEREARALRNDVRDLRYQFRDFARDGLSNWEFRKLEARIDNIRFRLRGERQDHNNHRM